MSNTTKCNEHRAEIRKLKAKVRRLSKRFVRLVSIADGAVCLADSYAGHDSDTAKDLEKQLDALLEEGKNEH